MLLSMFHDDWRAIQAADVDMLGFQSHNRQQRQVFVGNDGDLTHAVAFHDSPHEGLMYVVQSLSLTTDGILELNIADALIVHQQIVVDGCPRIASVLEKILRRKLFFCVHPDAIE